MVTTQNFTAQISQPRRTELKPTVGGFDATLSVGPAFEEERTTTFQRFHEIAPAEARKGTGPAREGRRRPRRGRLPRERQPRAPRRRGVQHEPRVLHQERHGQGLLDTTRDVTSLGSGPGGRCGARGPLVRNAGEAGCRNAYSVWADDYGHGV